MPIPEEIRGMRPKGLFKATEVRFISGYYYVYDLLEAGRKEAQAPEAPR